MRVLLIIAFFGLAACGVDGAPEPKGDGSDLSGVIVTGQASIGVGGSF